MTKRSKRNKRWWLAIPLVAALAGGGYYYYTTTQLDGAATSAETTMQTARARTGELVISATAAGTVIAAGELSLGFSTTGELLELYVQTGDKVAMDAPLARIDDLVARKAVLAAEKALAAAQTTLTQVQEDLADLTNPASADLLEAQAAVAAATETLAEIEAGATAAELAAAQAAISAAQDAYDTLCAQPDPDDVTTAQLNLDKAKNSLWSAQMSRDAQGGQRSIDSGAYDSAQVGVLNAEISVQQAEMSLAAAQLPATEAELQNAFASLLNAQQNLADLKNSPSQAERTTAQAALARAQETLDSLTVGANASEIVLAEAAVRQAELGLQAAELELQAAQADLDDTTLKAPLAATVTEVLATVGEQVGSADVFTLANLEQPQLEIFVDESDIGNLAVGYEVEVVFDALPDDIFYGTVTQVDPTLSVESSTSVVRGLVTLNPESFAKPQGLMVGMNATVDVIGGRAENAVLVPVEALRDLGDGQYAVFVVENDIPILRAVTVGLQDYTYAEITSGLSAGETVSTGITAVSQ